MGNSTADFLQPPRLRAPSPSLTEALSTYTADREIPHRIADWLRWEGTSRGWLAQPSLLMQGHLGPLAQDHRQAAFEYLRGRRLPKLSGQPVP